MALKVCSFTYLQISSPSLLTALSTVELIVPLCRLSWGRTALEGDFENVGLPLLFFDFMLKSPILSDDCNDSIPFWLS